MEEDLNSLSNWKTASILGKMEDNLDFKVNRRRPQFSNMRKMTSIFQYLKKWKTSSFLGKMEDDLNCLAKGKKTSIYIHG
jgi:hypothetical protein